jgi:hypothetical protein
MQAENLARSALPQAASFLSARDESTLRLLCRSRAAQCRRLFLPSTSTQRLLSRDEVKQLHDQGFVVVDSFVSPKLVADVVDAVRKSLAPASRPRSLAAGFMEALLEAFGPSIEPLIAWRDPFPRGRWRDDRVSFIVPGRSPCHLDCFKKLLSRFDGLKQEISRIVQLSGHRVERQLAMFRPSTHCAAKSRGYMTHLDALPDDGTKANRRITCILYLNSGKIQLFSVANLGVLTVLSFSACPLIVVRCSQVGEKSMGGCCSFGHCRQTMAWLHHLLCSLSQWVGGWSCS